MDGVIFETQRFGGISRMYTELLDNLEGLKQPVNVSVFTNRFASSRVPRNGCVDHFTIASPERFARPGRVFSQLHPVIRRVFAERHLAQRRNSIWHSTYYTMPTSWEGPVVTTVYDMIHERFPELFRHRRDESMRRRKRTCITSADALIAISEATKKDVADYYHLDPERIHVIHLAPSPSFTAPPETKDTSGKRPYLLYVGGRAHYKNVWTLLEGYALWDQRTEVRLVFVGPMPSTAELDLLTKLGIDSLVSFQGYPDDEKLAHLYSQALALVYPSLYEGFGIPLVEAMSMGCPIIASKIPSSLEVASDCALYFEPQDIDSLVDALNGVTEERRRQSLINAGYRRASRFSWSRSAAKLAETYASVMDLVRPNT